MVQDIGLHEITIGGEACVVGIVDVVTRDPIASLVGVRLFVPRFVVAAVRRQFVPDTPIRRHPHADVRIGCRAHAGFPTGRTTIPVVSTSAG